MWLEASLCLAVLLATIIYFPSAPSSPPSESAAVKRGSSTGTYAQLFPTSRQESCWPGREPTLHMLHIYIYILFRNI